MKSLSTSAPASNIIGRRALLGIIPAWLALPRLSTGSTLEPGRPSARAVRVLDPADPVAVELARLYDVLLTTHRPEYTSYRAVNDYDDHSWKEGGDPVFEAIEREFMLRSGGRRAAYFALLHAVVEADGGPDLDEPRWMSFGIPLHTVRAGNRIYVVSSDNDVDYDPGVGLYGFAAVNVIDLVGIGGGA